MTDNELYARAFRLGLRKFVHDKHYHILLARTNYLNADTLMRCRLFHLIHGKSIPTCKCKTCNHSTTWSRKNNKYNEYCSAKCRGSDPLHLKKMKDTCIERYGVENPMHAEHIKSKCLQSNLKNYNNAIKLKEINDKRKSTSLTLFGVDNIFKDTTFIRDSVRKKYGRDNYSQIHMDMDDCNVENIKYMNVELSLNSVEIANKLHIAKSTVCRILKRNNISITRHRTSSSQQEITDVISELGIDVIVNDRTIIKPLELDIVIPSQKIAIEYCGLYWHDHNHVARQYHRQKMLVTNSKGYKLITIFEDEWYSNKELVINMLKHKLNVTEHKIYARKTEKKIINIQRVGEFLEANHLQGKVQYTYAYALVYNDNIVAVMTFIKRGSELELNRFCTSYNVVGGFSKLLKYAINDFGNNYNTIISFADLRWSDGNVYKVNGFKNVGEIPIDYSFVKGYNRYHKFNFRKNKIKNKFEKYDDTLSIVQNCLNHGYRKIYDCGKIKFEYNIK